MFTRSTIKYCHVRRRWPGALRFSRVALSLDDAVRSAPTNAIFDVALPPGEFLGVLRCIPSGSTVLLQKPMGQNLDEARAIRDLCHARRLTAAVNFQLRRAPAVTKARAIIAEGGIGTLHDIEVRVTSTCPGNSGHFWRKPRESKF